MVQLEEILKGYFHYEEDLNETYRIGLSKFYANSKAVVRFESEEYQLKGAISHISQEKRGMEAVLHIPDRVMIRQSEEKCSPPLQFVQSCNYMYYGCYMSIACYLLNINPDYVTLYHPVDDHNKYTLKYRPQMAKLFLDNRKRSLKAIRLAEQSKQDSPVEEYQNLEIFI